MINNRVLLVDDDPVTLMTISQYLISNQFEVETAVNGQEAIQKFATKMYSVVITDLNMPEMNGYELARELKHLDFTPAVIVLSIEKDVENVIKVMREGVFDYIIKPVHQNELIAKTIKAFEYFELQNIKKITEKEKEIRVQRELENKRTIDKIVNRNYDKFDKELFANLKTNFSQGAGFGGLIALISLLSQTLNRKDDKYLIDAELMDMIIENAKSGKSALDLFGEIEEILEKKFEYESISIDHFLEFVDGIIKSLSKTAAIKQQKILLSENRFKNSMLKLHINRIMLKKVFEELFVNAFKFSLRGTSIVCFPTILNDIFSFSIINITEDISLDVKGIPIEYQKLIFEPFFRLTRIVDERFNTLDFGLGLTMVEKVIRKHNGTVKAGNVTDYSQLDKVKNVKVNIEINLPLFK